MSFAEKSQIDQNIDIVYSHQFQKNNYSSQLEVLQRNRYATVKQWLVQTIIHADECSETIVVVDTPIDDEQVS